MKKLVFLLVVLLSVSFSVAAGDDGQIPTGGRSCPPGQTCFVEPDHNLPTTENKKTWFQFVFDELKFIFR